jgi:hypothetical protein
VHHSVIAGVGPATAAKLVTHFGERTLDVLNGADAATQLARCPGLGPRTAAKIKAAWDDGTSARAGMSFLQGLGASAALAKRAVDAHGGATEAVVRGDPFTALKGLRGANFDEVDALAAALAVPPAHPSRVAAALTDALAGYGASRRVTEMRFWRVFLRFCVFCADWGCVFFCCADDVAVGTRFCRGMRCARAPCGS